MYRSSIKFTACLLLGLLAGNANAQAEAATVNLYSARSEPLIKPLLQRFTAQTGIRVNLVTGKADALLKRLQIEGQNSPADLLLTTDAGRLHRAKQAGVTQPVSSPLIEQTVPAQYRDPDGHWVGLSLRARPILYVKGKVQPQQLSSYEALTDAQWKGRICIRSSNNIYNQSLLASMIAANGAAAAQQWANGLVANLARPPRGGDRDQIKAAASGQCDIAIANTYYLAGMLNGKDPAQKAAAEKLAVFWPNQDGRGAHVNVSGAAVTRSAKHPQAARQLIEFLLSEQSQAWYGKANGEYPVRSEVAQSAVLQGFGSYRADTLNLAQLGELNAQAVRIMDRAGWR